jgi:hypothetical protein
MRDLLFFALGMLSVPVIYALDAWRIVLELWIKARSRK